MEKVNVMLSTYNGEKFLKEQIGSILNQKKVIVNLYIRDDGSSDSTKEILSSIEQQNINIVYGKNIGWKRSFLNLLFNVPINKNEFYAFADQDDVWKEDKLYSAIKKIREEKKPTLYHSNMTMVNEKLEFIRNRYRSDFYPSIKMPQAFFDGVGTGSTMVFNTRFLNIVRQYKPNEEIAHDAYLMALANLFGKVIYDKESHILYRRFEDNATGYGKNSKIGKPSMIDRYRRYKKLPKMSYSIRAKEIISGYSKLLDNRELSFLTKLSNYKESILTRVLLLVSPSVKASSFKKSLIIKYRILTGTL